MVHDDPRITRTTSAAGTEPTPEPAAHHTDSHDPMLVRCPQDRLDLDELYRTHSTGIAVFLVKTGADIEEARDATQTAFEKAWEKWPTLPPAPKARLAWLHTTAFRAYLKGTPRHARHRTNAPVPDLPDPTAGPEDALLLTETRALYDHLPMAQRQCLALYINGYSYTEIADLTGKTEPAARQNVSRALNKLREVTEQ